MENKPISLSRVAVTYSVIATMLVQSFHFAFLTLLPVFTMTPFQIAYASDSEKWTDLRKKYDTANPENNYTNNDRLNKTLAKYKDQKQKPNIEQKLISKYYQTPPKDKKKVNLSKYPIIGANFNDDFQQSINTARSLFSNVAVPESSQSGDLNIKYNPDGVELSKDKDGNYSATYDKSGEMINRVSQDEYTSSEIGHSKTTFTADQSYGDEKNFYSQGKTKLNSLKTSTASDGLVYQMLQAADESNPVPEINHRDSMFDYGYEAVNNAIQSSGGLFEACADTTVKRVDNVHYSTWDYHSCAAVNQNNKNYCEVQREYIPTTIIENYEGNGKLSRCGENCLEIEFGELGEKTKKEGQCWDVNYNANLQLSDKVKISHTNLTYSIEDHAKLAVNGQDVWSNIKGVQGTGGTLPNKGDGCLARPTWSGTDQGNLLPELQKVVNGLGDQANLNFTVRYGEEGEGHMKVRMYFTALDGGELGLRFKQSPEGCYDKLTKEAKIANPLDFTKVSLPTTFTTSVNIASQGRDILTGDFDLVKGEVRWNEALNDSPIQTRISEIEKISYGTVCSAIPSKISAQAQVWTDYNLPGIKDESVNYRITQAPTCENGLKGQIQIRDQQSGDQVEWTLGVSAKIKFTFEAVQSNYIPVSNDKFGFCTFDEYQILDQGSGGFPDEILELVPQWFFSDTGLKTWKINLKGFNCDPLKGNKHCVTNAAGEQECYSFNELKEKPSQCNSYVEDDSCIEVNRTCGEGWEVDGRCLISTVEYKCDVGNSYEITTEENTNACAETLPCVDGSCDYGEREKNEQFIDAMAMASTLQHMEDDMQCDDPADLTTCRVFNGEGKFCSWELSGLGTDCCESPGGIDIFSYASAAQGIMQADAYAAGLESTNAVVNSYQSLREPIADGITTAWEAVSQPITDAFTSAAGTAAGEVATSEGAKQVAEEGVMSQLGQTAMNFMAENLPADLSEALFTQAATEAGGQGAGDYVLSEGASQVVSVLGYIYGAYVIYQYVKLALQLLTACHDYEGDMGIKLETKQCIPVAQPYCHDKFLGTCLVRRRDYCCYGSILARIIMEQASPMVGHDLTQLSDDVIDESEIRACPGLTPEQLANLDFSKINLNEWTNIMLQSGIISNDNTEESLTGDGRMINSGIRVTTTERTKDRVGNSNLADHAINAAKKIKEENIDCSLVPRPTVCYLNDD
ncbi:conjugal transfer protein TraN (plasmid) [Psychrobium sp. nBUS_13]|uniref:conjugal transfer protein TraN n=1 Tax=Psychrobium sp. nBUS_13 TaxID=3395319 RepID=UPI003EBC3D35